MKKHTKKRLRQSVVAGAAVATLGLAGVTGIGLASADSATSGQSSLIDKIATKFNLNKDEVAAVFKADYAEHRQQMQANQASRLAQAVKDGKLTQAQADYITKAHKEIEALIGDSEPGQVSEATRASIKAKMEALRTWAESNKVDRQYLGMMGHGGPGGPGMGGPGGPGIAGSSSAN